MKSAKPDAFSSPETDEVGTKYVVEVKEVGKKWFYCGVANHCKTGMYGSFDSLSAVSTL